jgi:hypothetical protein
MKRLILLWMVFLTFSNIISAQELLLDTEDVVPADVMEPEFSGGYEAFYQLLYAK